jgi:hypothetical protein
VGKGSRHRRVNFFIDDPSVRLMWSLTTVRNDFPKSAADGREALIPPDELFEERTHITRACGKYGIGLIPLIAPTFERRVATITLEADFSSIASRPWASRPCVAQSLRTSGGWSGSRARLNLSPPPSALTFQRRNRRGKRLTA